MTVSAWLSAAAKNSKSDDPNGHRFCDKKSVTQKVSKPMYSTASFLSSVRFVSDAALLRSLLCLVCRSSDSSIQAARLIAACDLAPYCQRIASAFSPGHDSPSNDRFSPRADYSAWKQCFRNTATLGSLPPGPARIVGCPDSLPANPMG